jgi:hypothetical protein
MTPHRFAAAALAVGVAVLSHAASASAQAPDQWWKKKSDNRLEERRDDGNVASRIKWDEGFLEVKAGATADPALILNARQGLSLAAKAARQLAYAKLAEIVSGVKIDGVTVVRNAMVVDSTIRSTVDGFIKGAVVVSETPEKQPDGSPWVDVVMRLPLHGAGSVSQSLAGWATGRAADAYRGDPTFPINEPYTGLIIDVSESAFSQALMPRVLEQSSSEKGASKVVYGPHVVQAGTLAQQGAVGYALAPGDARQSGRVGRNPLVVRAVATTGGPTGDIILTTRDAERVLAADRTGRFLERAAVVVVRGRDAVEQLARQGRRHAIVVGVEDYAQGYPKLNYAVRDARALADALRGVGRFPAENVTFIENGTRDEVVAAFRALQPKVGVDDTVVIYFAGHGAIANGPDGKPHYYLVPRDGRLGDLAATGLRDDQLEELIGKLDARRIVVVLDACYSGGGTGVIRARGVTTAATPAPPGRPPIEPAAGRVVLSASQPDQPAYEDDTRGGLFTSFVLEGLRGAADANRDGNVSVLELADFVSERVQDYMRRQHQKEQSPVLEVRGLSGKIVLAWP